jgi:alpha-maltose-1-phosphate synthase
LEALQEVAARTKKKVVLVLCGQFPNEAVGIAFSEATKQHAPNVRLICVDGRDFDAYRGAWAASDIFVSLSDNLQETFGITPVEAMASGLPVIVSDWDGYKDTIIDGETGFRIPTWMPPPDVGMALAAAFEAGTINYDRYIGLACLDVSVDQRSLVNCLEQLVQDPALRARLGAAGKIRATQVYEWSVVMAQHESLWAELDDLRTKTISQNLPQLKSAPRCAPARQDPYRVFSSFTTSFIKGDTVVVSTKKILGTNDWDALLQEPMFSFASSYVAESASVVKLIEALYARNKEIPDYDVKVSDLANDASFSLAKTIKIVALIAKMNFIELKNSQ